MAATALISLLMPGVKAGSKLFFKNYKEFYQAAGRNPKVFDKFVSDTLSKNKLTKRDYVPADKLKNMFKIGGNDETFARLLRGNSTTKRLGAFKSDKIGMTGPTGKGSTARKPNYEVKDFINRFKPYGIERKVRADANYKKNYLDRHFGRGQFQIARINEADAAASRVWNDLYRGHLQNGRYTIDLAHLNRLSKTDATNAAKAMNKEIRWTTPLQRKIRFKDNVTGESFGYKDIEKVFDDRMGKGAFANYKDDLLKQKELMDLSVGRKTKNTTLNALLTKDANKAKMARQSFVARHHPEGVAVNPFNTQLVLSKSNTAEVALTKKFLKDLEAAEGRGIQKEIISNYNKNLNELGIGTKQGLFSFGQQGQLKGSELALMAGKQNKLGRTINPAVNKELAINPSFADGGSVLDFDELIRINIEDHGMENKDAIDEAIKDFLASKKGRQGYLSGGAVGVGSGGVSGLGVDNKVGTFQSILAGIGAGILDIPKGAFSLGASLVDLGLGTDKAASVENFFDNLTTLDEKAEATTAGKITRILTNLGIPGTAAFKTASGLTKRALLAKEKGNYFKLTKDLDGKLQKTMTTKGRLLTTLGGAAGVGASDAIFVGDPEQVGTLGDAFNIGITKLRDNDQDDAAREVMNRLKFGVDSLFLGGIIGGTGSAMKMAVQRSNTLNRNNDIIDKILDYTTPQGAKTREFFDTERVMLGKKSAQLNRAQVLHRQMDKHIDGLFPILKQITSAEVRRERDKVVKVINDAMTSSEKGPTVDFIRGIDDEIIGGRFDLGDMSPALLNKIKDIKGLDFEGVVDLMQKSRDIIGDTFSDIGSNIIRAGKRTDEALPEVMKKFDNFKEAFKVKSLDYINNTYRIFKNGEIDALSSYKPTEEAVQNAKQLFIQLSKQRNAADPTVKVLTDQEAAYAVDRLLAESKKYPKFMTEGEVVPLIKDETGFLKDLAIKDFTKPLLPLNKITKEKIEGFDVTPREVIENLLGKVEDPSATILSSMNNLALIQAKHNFYGDLYERFKGKQFFETRSAAAAVFGDRNVLNTPIRMMATEAKSSDGRLFTEAVNPLNGLFTSKGNQEALEGLNKNMFSWTENNNMFTNFYNNFILYPKATSQLAKTVLSPVTHARNLISAGAFAAANGLIPLVNREALDEAYGAFAQVGKKGTDAYNKRYQKLLELGVVNSSARLGDLTEILADVNFGARTSQIRALRGATRAGSKLKQFATDLYTAEDDFWKMYTFAAERQRIAQSLKRAGIDGSAFAKSEKNNLGRTFDSFDDYLDEAAADIVRNNVPNYDYVSNFIKDLRRAPIGNFVSFPAEIIRTSINIVKKGLDDFNYIAPNGTKPFRNVGMTRLAGFGLTTAAIPYGLVEGFKAAQNVTGIEMDALRRFVPDWSKNSNLIPIRDDDGKLKYVDFSHANAYDTISRPLKTVFNALADGRTDNDTVMEDFVQGVVESTSELGAPFISESIWTQGISDIFVRGGRTKDGRRLYTDQTPFGEKFSLAVKHLAETQYPGSLAQGQRLYNSITKNPDEYGRTYELKDEVLGFAGLRAVEVDPVQSMKFKIADFRTGINNARREFTSPLLKGGAVTAEQIVDRYQVANQALFNVQKEMSKDYYGALLLGATPKNLNAQFADRVSNVQLRSIIKGNFKPFIPSENIEKAFRENAREIGGNNAYRIAKETIRRMAKQYSRLSLFEDALPLFDNPYKTSALPDLGLSNVPAPTTGLGLQTPGVSGITNNIQTTALKGQRVFGPNDTVFGG